MAKRKVKTSEAGPASEKPEGPGFEELLAETETLVEELESGELTLDEAVRKYEKGLANLKACSERLARAEEAVKVLVAESETSFRLEDLDADQDAADTDEDEED